MKILEISCLLLIGLLGWATAKPSESNNDAREALVEIEKQRLIKFPEEYEQLGTTYNVTNKTDDAQRILQEIEKINQALGYVKRQEHSHVPAILDSSQYLFPNTGYQPFHVQNPQIMGSHGETLLVPSIRSIKFEHATKEHRASEFNKPPVKKPQKLQKITKPTKPLFFHPHRVEVPVRETPEEKKLLPTHFVIPVRLYKKNKQEYVEKHAPQEYKVKGYKIVGDIDHFYGKSKNKTLETKEKSSSKYHLLFLPQEVVARNTMTDIEALNSSSSAENSSREEKLANRPVKLQTNSQSFTNGNVINATSSATIIRKRVVPKPLKGESILGVTSSSVIKVTPAPATAGQSQPQRQQQQQQQQQHQQPQQPQQYQTQYQKPNNVRPNTQPGVATQTYLNQQQQLQQQQQLLQQQHQQQQLQQYQKPSNQRPNTLVAVPPIAFQTGPTAVGAGGNNNNNNNNNNNINDNNNDSSNNGNNIKNRYPILSPLLGLQANLQNNINNINNATSTAIRNAFQNIFRLPLNSNNNNNNDNNNNNNNNNNVNKPFVSAPGSENQFPYIQAVPLQIPPKQQQQQYYYTMLTPQSVAQNPLFVSESLQNDHMTSDYKWDDENDSTPDSNDSEEIETTQSNESPEPAEKKIFGHIVKHKQETQKEALKQGGIIIQKLKVRKGGIAIAGPGGVATAGSGGTAIVGPGGYALTHPRSLTIAGPGAKVIAIPSDVDLRDALSRTDLKTHMLPREGRIVATGPTVYYAPGTGEGIEILT